MVEEEGGSGVHGGDRRDTHWLRIPVGKLHNDRYVPLLPSLVELIDNHRATRAAPRSGPLVEHDDGRPFDRRTIHRYVTTIARHAGIGHVHPHQLRHTLATHAINRGMSLEAIAALLGHRSMKMTLTYVRIASPTPPSPRSTSGSQRRVEANYRVDELPATTAGNAMTQLAADHRRLLGNGHCNRPAALDCAYESMCERCGFFETDAELVPILIRQRDHAADRPARPSPPLHRTTRQPRQQYLTVLAWPQPEATDHRCNSGSVTTALTGWLS